MSVQSFLPEKQRYVLVPRQGSTHQKSVAVSIQNLILPKMTRVKVNGLSNTQYNGLIGMVAGFSRGEGRYDIKVCG